MYRLANPDNADQYCGGTPFPILKFNMVLINSWYFDFEKMEATRDPKWEHYDYWVMKNWTHRLSLAVDSLGRVGRAHAACGDVVAEHFFHAPEDNFNEAINQAYIAFLFEKQILSSGG